MKRTVMVMAATALMALSGAAQAGGPIQINTEKAVVVTRSPKSNPTGAIIGVVLVAALFGLGNSSGSHGSNLSN